MNLDDYSLEWNCAAEVDSLSGQIVLTSPTSTDRLAVFPNLTSN